MLKNICFLSLILFACTDGNDETFKTFPKNESLEVNKLKQLEDLNLENHHRFLTIENLNENLVYKEQKFKCLKVLDKVKGNDHTAIVLDMFEKLKAKWYFHSFDSSNKKRYKYYESNLLDSYFLYDKDPDTDYKESPKSYVVSYSKNNTKTNLDNLILFRPRKGKRKYQGRDKLKKLLIHKNLGKRNGCVMNIEFKNDTGGQMFRGKKQFFHVFKLYYTEDGTQVFVKLVNFANHDQLILRASLCDKPEDTSEVSSFIPDFESRYSNLLPLLNPKRKLSHLKKRLAYIGTGCELFLIYPLALGCIACVDTEQSEDSSDICEDRNWTLKESKSSFVNQFKITLEELKYENQQLIKALGYKLQDISSQLTSNQTKEKSKIHLLEEELKTICSESNSTLENKRFTIKELTSSYQKFFDLLSRIDKDLDDLLQKNPA